jgi:hypothetical protein
VNVLTEPSSAVLTEEKLLEIRKLLKDAQFGYAVVNNQIYWRDVALLLADRDLWLAANSELAAQVKQLKSDNADLGLRLDEALRAREDNA